MNENTRKQYRKRAEVFKALGHPTRLFIVEQLARGERCVCELTDMVGADMSTVSRHLSVLKNAGILEDDKRGASVYYRLVMPCVTNFMYCINGVVGGDAEGRESVASSS